MAGAKRSASDSEPRETRASKTPKTTGSPKNSKTSGKGGRKGPKAALAPSAFKSKALPLHVNFTHTPPAITDDSKTVASTTADPGAIGSATLVPTEFSTGSYGWKGSKRVTIEIPNPDGGEGGKVQVMITINATVIGSKVAKDEDEDANGSNEATEQAEKGEETGDATSTVAEK